jgi:hypothetical protein
LFHGIFTDCIDHQGKLVKVGEFFTEPAQIGDKFTTVECVGNEFLAKKVIHRCSLIPLNPSNIQIPFPSKGSNCELPNGKKLVEGDFTLQEVPKRTLRSQLQRCLLQEEEERALNVPFPFLYPAFFHVFQMK